MFIVPQEYQDGYFKYLSTYLNDLLYPLEPKGKVSNFVNLIELISYDSENLARQRIVNYLEKLDMNFKNSDERKTKYYVKDYRSRTIITIYGEITYRRTIYTDKYTGSRYIYVDSKMGIAKYIRYTNDVRAYAYESYADENSMIKVGKELGNLIHCKFSLKRNDEYALSRQTIYNFLNIKPIHYIPKQKRQVNKLYILLDEKFIGCQDKDKKIMSKVCLIYEDIIKSKRNKLVNKTYFSSSNNEFKYDLLTYIDEIYDIDKIKEIYFMSDGGSWIKDTINELIFPNTKTIRCLDKFHANRSLSNIVEDYNTRSIAQYYIDHNDLDSFTKSIKHFVRKENEADYKYLVRNFNEIVNMYHCPAPCAMEQCISHHVMSQFTSVPKAYSSKNIEKYLSMRDNYRNGVNLKELILEALETNTDAPVIAINKIQLDFSIFDKKSDIPYYDTSNLRGKSLFLPL